MGVAGCVTLVFRKHQVVRHALEYYMEDRESFRLSTLEEACVYILHQVNFNMSFVNGFFLRDGYLVRPLCQCKA